MARISYYFNAKIARIMLLTITLFIYSIRVIGQIYEYIDHNGNKIYSNKPPAENNFLDVIAAKENVNIKQRLDSLPIRDIKTITLQKK